MVVASANKEKLLEYLETLPLRKVSRFTDEFVKEAKEQLKNQPKK